MFDDCIFLREETKPRTILISSPLKIPVRILPCSLYCFSADSRLLSRVFMSLPVRERGSSATFLRVAPLALLPSICSLV